MTIFYIVAEKPLWGSFNKCMCVCVEGGTEFHSLMARREIVLKIALDQLSHRI